MSTAKLLAPSASNAHVPNVWLHDGAKLTVYFLGTACKQDEVRHRRDEFARLLDEHEQVVRELRRIESSSELQSMAETGSRAEEAMLSDFASASVERQEE